MERVSTFRPEVKRAFTTNIRQEAHTQMALVDITNALDCLIAFDIVVGEGDADMTFEEFLRSYENIIPANEGSTRESVVALEQKYHTSLISSQLSTDVGKRSVIQPARHAIATIGMWNTLGKINKETKSVDIVDRLTVLFGEHPEAAKHILESLGARLTVGEVVTKPALAFAGIVAIAHGLPGWMSSEQGTYALVASTILLAIAKTQQDISNHKHHMPYLTVETNILTEILGFELHKSAYFVRIAWLLPVLGSAVISHIQRGTDISPILVSQDLLYLGPMVVDLLLRLNLLDAVVSSVQTAWKRVTRHSADLS